MVREGGGEDMEGEEAKSTHKDGLRGTALVMFYEDKVPVVQFEGSVKWTDLRRAHVTMAKGLKKHLMKMSDEAASKVAPTKKE